MSKRKENIRKACESIDAILKTQLIEPLAYVEIKILLRRIKRTTWRNNKNNEHIELSKRINTNTTTTANINTTIAPYY